MSADPKPDPRLVFRGLVADGEHEHFYRALVEGAPAALYIDEPSVTGRTLYMSPRIETLLGYTSDELTSTVDVWLDRIVHPADRALTVAVTTDNSEGRRGAIEYRCIHKDGSVVWLHDESVPVFNDDGDVVAVHGFLQDITARRSAEQEVHEAEERYRSLVEDMPAIVYLDAPDETGSAIYLSPKVEDLFGYTREEWASAPDFFVNEILHPGDRERVLDVIACNNVGISNRSEYRCITKDGRVVWIYDEAHPQLDSDGAVVATRGFLLDITDRKEAEAELALREEQLRSAQRMEAVGRLAGGVAHDFNNLLTVIRGHLHLLLDSAGVSPAMRDQLEEVSLAAERASELTGHLLAFSRQQVLQPVALQLEEVVHRLESMLLRLLPADIAFVVAAGDELPSVVADRGQIEQVVTNLVLNARDAMPDGGQLRIEIDAAVVAERDGRGVPPGAYVELRVSDTGHGMDAATLERIFEPFFTTKEQGRGTGLGLATVEGIVAQSGGYLTVESAPGEGTTFVLVLPVGDGTSEASREVPRDGLVGGDESILVVEDDPAVRRLVTRVLSELGYVVLEASGPEAALELVSATQRLDLLLTDLVMPGGTGRALAAEVVELRPEIGIIFMSGYTDDEIVRRGFVPGSGVFVQKPFRLEELAGRVREVLDQRAGRLS